MIYRATSDGIAPVCCKSAEFSALNADVVRLNAHILGDNFSFNNPAPFSGRPAGI
jgi:hypothetical protein